MVIQHYPLVSVLVPVYKAEKYIKRCARSLFEQTYDNLEYIFCDDCSPDASIQKLEEVMKDYPARLGHVKIIRHNRNKGIAVVRNELTASCRGIFLFWVDSDDWVESNAVEILIKKQQETDADIVTGRAYAHLVNRTIRCHDGWNLDKNTLMENIIKAKSGATLWRRLIRKSLFIDNNIRFPEEISYREDYVVIIFLLFHAKKIAGIDDVVYHYDMTNGNSISHERQTLSFELSYLESCRLIVDFFEGKNENCYHMCNEMMVKRAHEFMMIQFRNRCRRGYLVMVDHIKKIDKDYWNKIKWNNWLIRVVESHYYLMRLTYPLRIFRRKLLGME